MKGQGALQVFLCTAVTSMPIRGGQIRVFEAGRKTPCATAQSDAEGNAHCPALPCPKREDTPPYLRYTVLATARGYEPFQAEIPVFDGVTSYRAFPLRLQKKEKE